MESIPGRSLKAIGDFCLTTCATNSLEKQTLLNDFLLRAIEGILKLSHYSILGREKRLRSPN